MISLKKPTNFSPNIEVSACFLLYEEETLTLKTQDHKKLGGLWGAPAGKIEKKENATSTAIRELMEETGIAIRKKEIKTFKTVYVKWPTSEFVYHMFYIQFFKKPKVKINPKEHSDYFWGNKYQVLALPNIPDEDECLKMFYDEIVDKNKVGSIGEITNNPKAIVGKSEKFGRGLFAIADIAKGETIAEFDGKIYTAKLASLLPNNPPLFVRDHAIQFSETKWRYSKYGVLFNHSCNPNCGIKGAGKSFRINTKNILPAT
ncbi:MAG: NUDIX domain-containing protein [Candidatus Diapherotrites archaeon]|nr:NUDIX domain-containing protein [Candidatus Diapherotrites archaeon]